MRITLLLFLLLCSSTLIFAQNFTLSGTVKDDKGLPIPFATVVVKGTSKGSPANSDGEYGLSLPSGNYDIVFKAIGFKQQIKAVTLTANRTLNIDMEPEAFQLQNVVVKAGGEDPAYAIIRKAIRKRSTYLTEVKSYQCDTYIKGLQRMLTAPKKFLGRDIDQISRELGLDSNRKGILYLSESESKLSFMQPDRYHEEMVSSKVSGSNRAFSFNRASDLDVNFYQNLQDWGGISNRPLVSPIADNALSFYNYKYMGETVENGETINRIQVTPKRQFEPTFQGYIYIIEDSWRIHSTDLYLTKSAGINFLDTISVKQQYIPVGRKAWMPSSVKLEFVGGLFGFRIGGYFVAVYKNYEIDPKLDKKLFAEVMKVTAGVNKKDSTYWQQARPIPLTGEETTDYEKKAVLARKRESKPYLDSLDRVHNRVSASRFLFSGLSIRNRYKKTYFNTQSVIGSMLYNTIEGVAINYGASFRKQIDSARNKYLLLNGRIRYGFGNQLLHGSVNGVIPVNDYRLGFNLGSDVVDLNNNNPMTPLANTFATLLYRNNYQKLYDKDFAAVSLSRRIVGGWQASVAAEAADRKWLDNTSYFSFFYQDKRFTPNNPFAQNVDDHTPLFDHNRSFKINVRTSYDFSDRYVTYPTGRYYLPSKYPKIEVSYTKGIKNVLGSDVDYDLLTASINKDDVDLGLWGKFSFYAGAGKFLTKKSVYYLDAKHFLGTEIFRYRDAPDVFLLLDYYTYSTADQYLEGHIEHNFGGIIMSKVPLLRKLKLQEIFKANYLSTPHLKNYTELAAGLKYLGVKAMYGWSYNSGQNTRHAFRFEIGF